MPIYGVLTQLETLYDGKRQNRWWVNAPTVDEAINRGQTLVNLLRPVFGTTCQFVNIHAWEPNSNPNNFRNKPIASSGLYDALNPTNAVPCIKITMTGAGSSYPNAKYLRVCLEPNTQVGRIWGSGPLTAAQELVEGISELAWLTEEDGNVITDYAIDVKVHYRQLAKKWYNRGS